MPFGIRPSTSRHPATLRHGLVCSANQQPATPALDSLSSSTKLNAVIDSMARKQDRGSTLQLINELKQVGGCLERTALTSVINAFVAAPNELENLLYTVLPTGYGSRSLCSIRCQKDDEVDAHAYDKIDPEKALDVSVAVGFCGLVASALSVEVVEPVVWHHAADEATALLCVLLLSLAYDRYAASSTTWRRIQRGLIRLFRDDPIRASRVDAACFLTAYVLGLPWICFKPDGRRVGEWIESKGVDGEELDELVDRCLIWIVSAVVVEQELDGMLIESDLKVAYGVLRKRKGARVEKKTVCQAMTRAKALLREYQHVHAQLADNMLRGASVGERLQSGNAVNVFLIVSGDLRVMERLSVGGVGCVHGLRAHGLSLLLDELLDAHSLGGRRLVVVAVVAVVAVGVAQSVRD
ncbi:hypothetical protein FGB62_44g147 [Gracilaria domingensis]|nr:hypothetical protein FGB62_44g147 [Gracilaria domingensis]